MSTALAVSGSFGGLSVAPSFRYSDDMNTKVKIPAGGSTTWSWETVLGVETAKEIKGVMVALSEPQADLWPMSGPNDGSLPYMVRRKPIQSGPASASCSSRASASACSHDHWGSTPACTINHP